MNGQFRLCSCQYFYSLLNRMRHRLKPILKPDPGETDMSISLTKAALAAMIGFGTISAAPATASASGLDVDFYFGIGPGPGHHYDYRERRRDDHRWHERRRGCSERKAVRKARRIGLRGARIVRHDRRKLVIKGRVRGHREYIAFANMRGCPVIRY
jgi:hypothetical protein